MVISLFSDPVWISASSLGLALLLGAVTLREHPALWASLVLQGRP